jgi:DNA-binding beta-propeller fold protein YncE
VTSKDESSAGHIGYLFGVRQAGIRPFVAAVAFLSAVATFCLMGLSVLSASAVVTHPQIRVGGFPTGMSLNPATDTLYVGNGTADNVSLISGRTCNAASTTGCGQHIVAVSAGRDPIGSIEDQSSNTIYVINSSSDSVVVLGGATCDAAATSGCSTTLGQIAVGSGPEFGDLNPKTHTLYVANVEGNTISVINTSSCNAETQAGCGTALVASIQTGSGSEPFAVAVNPSTDTVYVTDLGTRTVAVLDGATCNATITSRCTPDFVPVGAGPAGIAVDQATDTVYVADETSDQLSVFSGASCNASVTSGCRRPAFHVAAGNGARGVAVDDSTNTVYVVDTRSNSVTVLSARTCNGRVHSGCSRPARVVVGSSPRRVVIDPSTDTIYVSNAGTDTVSMIDGKTCNSAVHSGC